MSAQQSEESRLVKGDLKLQREEARIEDKGRHQEEIPEELRREEFSRRIPARNPGRRKEAELEVGTMKRDQRSWT